MGLDIYLYERRDQERMDELYDELYGVREDLPDDEQEAISKERKQEIEKELRQLRPYGNSAYASRTAPEFFMNRRYLRSSYNEASFNSVAMNTIGKDLYYIFEPCNPEEEHQFSPDADALRLSKQRAIEVRNDLQEAPPYRSTFFGPNPFRDEEEYQEITDTVALDIFLKELHDKAHLYENKEFGGYSTSSGSFFPEAIEVCAIIPGVSFGGRTGVHVVYEADFSSYITVAEVTIEFIDEALSLDDPLIVWSG